MRNALGIENCIIQIGNSKFSIDKNTNEYLFNNEIPRLISEDYFTKLHEEFNKRFIIQLKENANKVLLEEYIKLTITKIKEVKEKSNNLRLNYVYLKSKNQFPDTAINSYNDIIAIFSTQSSVLLKIRYQLEEGLKYIDFPTSVDYSETELNINTIPFSTSDKATFNLSKRESLMLLYLLEEHKIIEFKDKDHRRNFIEYNFQFKELRKNINEGSILPMIGISSELSKFNGRHEKKSNNRTLENLQKKLKEAIEYFEFK